MNVRLTEAHDMGLICPFKVAVADTQIDISSVDIDNGNYDEAQLERLINTPARNQAVVELHHQLGTTNRFMAFCSTLAHCDAIANSFASPTKGQDKLNIFSWTDTGTIKSGLVNSEGKALEGETLKAELARRLRLPHGDPNAMLIQHSVVLTQRFHGAPISQATSTPCVVIHHHDKLARVSSDVAKLVPYYGIQKHLIINAVNNAFIPVNHKENQSFIFVKEVIEKYLTY
jgi:hypothetical protein